MNLPFTWQSVLTILSSIHLCLSVYLCNLIHLSIHLYTFLFVYPSLVNCLSLQLIPSVYPSIYLPICLYISIYLYVYLSPLSYCLSPQQVTSLTTTRGKQSQSVGESYSPVPVARCTPGTPTTENSSSVHPTCQPNTPLSCPVCLAPLQRNKSSHMT